MRFIHALALSASAAALVAAVWPQHAAAQSAPAQALESLGVALEEVVVTAQKRSENLQDVPIAVSAVTANQLERQGVKDVLDLRIAVPTLNVTSSAGYLTTSLRGIGSNGIGAGIENPVALYIDGVYYASAASSLLSLNNVAQVEVLKGPQGTLFGRNATGGLIQISTRDPTQSPSGEFNVAYANYGVLSGSAYLAGGLTGNLRADIAIQGSRQSDGWGTNRSNGQDVYKIDHDWALRSKVVFEPSDNTKFTLIGDYLDHKDSMAAYRVFPNTTPGFTALPGQPAFGVFPSLGYDTDTDLQPITDNWAGGASLRWDQSLGSLKFMSLTAFRKSKARFVFDYDGTPQPIELIDEVQTDRQFSQEFQLSSPSAGRFSWVVGAFYFNARAAIDPFILTANDLGARVTIHNHQRTKSLAGYAQGTYAIFDRTNLTVGLRYTDEKRSTFDGTTDVLVIPLNLTIPSSASDREKSFSKLTYRISLDHKFTDEVLGYASYNRGFKSGGFNTSGPGSDPFRPETIDAYEAGLKSDFMDRRIRLNLAAFYYDYQDVQIQQLNAGAITIINGAGARVYGLDAELTAQVTKALRVDAGFGLLDPKFTSFPNCPTSTAAGGTPVVLTSCKGNVLPLASKAVANLSATYSVDIGDGRLDVNGNIYHNAGFHPESDNTIKQAEFSQFGASAKYTFASGFYLSAFGKNLTDKKIINFETTIPNGTHTGFFSAPRTYGVAIGYSF
jgi:iron complex outermembrane receptor protein